MITAVATLDIVFTLLFDFQPVWRSFALPGTIVTVLLGSAWFYQHVRGDARIATMLSGTAQLIAFASVAAPLSYIVTSWGGTLQDHALDHFDKAIGFDWRALLAWMDDHPQLHAVLRAIYLSLMVQSAAAVIALGFAAHFLWLRLFLCAFLMAALISIAVSAFMPALGTWAYYHITPADHPHIDPVLKNIPALIIDSLRSGAARQLLGLGAEGIITFPSLHAALAVILIVAFWPFALVRWVALLLNVTMLLATPVEGAHFLADVVAGLGVAGIALVLPLALCREQDVGLPLPG